MMKRVGKGLVLAALVATSLLAIMASAAAALRSLEINETGLRVTYRALTFRTETFEIECPATFEIVLERRRIPKTNGAKIGNLVLYRTEEGNCRESGRAAGFIRTLEERTAREVRYEGFTGTLPRIETIRITIEPFKFLMSAINGMVRCEFTGSAAGIFHVNEAGVVEPLEADSSRAITMSRALTGSIMCPARVTRQGLAVVLRREDLMGGVTLRLL